MLKRLLAIKDHSRRGRPKRIPWPKLNIVQVIKRYNGKHLSHIERFNATLCARLPSLVRRTRNLARTVKRLEMELFWSGIVYNFCTVHTTLQGTPTMAAGITEEVWSIRRLLSMRTPDIWDAELDHVFL